MPARWRCDRDAAQKPVEVPLPASGEDHTVMSGDIKQTDAVPRGDRCNGKRRSRFTEKVHRRDAGPLCRRSRPVLHEFADILTAIDHEE